MPRIPHDFYHSPLDFLLLPRPTYGCIFVESRVRLPKQDPKTAKVCAPGANLIFWHRVRINCCIYFVILRPALPFSFFCITSPKSYLCSLSPFVLHLVQLGPTRFNSAQIGSTRFNLEYAPTWIRRIGHKNTINFDFGLQPLKSASGLRGPKFCRLLASI